MNEEDYAKQIAKPKELGAVVNQIDDSVRIEWAESLKDWPRDKAKELDAAALPGTEVLNAALEEAEKLGHQWPLRYAID